MSYEAMRCGFDGGTAVKHIERLIIAVSVCDGQEGYREVAHLPAVRAAEIGQTLPQLRTLFPSPRYEVSVESRYEDGTR